MNLKNYIKPVSFEATKKILEQMTNCICKVKNNEKIGTGFFCKIPYKNNTKINVLITSYQLIDELYLNQNNQINLLINDYNELKVIYYSQDRKIFSSKNYNTTIIELHENDNINNYLELDDNLFRNDTNYFYEKESIYILQYLFGGKSSVSYGIFNELNGSNINHMCMTESGSNGAPILNLTNNKVIGISLETKDNIQFNKGIFLKYPFEEFINNYQNQIQQIPNQFNNNFQNMGMGMNNINNFMPNIMMNNNFMQNMINNNFMPLPTSNMLMGMNNFIPMSNKIMNNNIFNNNNNQLPKMNFSFNGPKGYTFFLLIMEQL